MAQRTRLNGTGSVVQLKDGRWLATAWMQGKRVNRYRKSRGEAELALAAMLAADGSSANPLSEQQPTTTWRKVR